MLAWAAEGLGAMLMGGEVCYRDGALSCSCQQGH